MADTYIERLKIGSIFPSSSSATLCLTKPKPINEMQLKKIKKGIMNYLKTHDGAYISDLSNVLRVEPKQIVYAINELKTEGLLL